MIAGRQVAMQRGSRDAGLGRDEAEAEWLWRAAAEAGDVASMSNLGVAFKQLNRPEEAEVWWRLATEEGDAHAMDGLANLLYALGRPEEADGAAGADALASGLRAHGAPHIPGLF
ncbi:tetratricopeptide repeat protein [Actinomadura sp. 9N407]|uniref:tetratricopeptide repeat protein n=1 Tax=Actinomadura sp. 9N407 TaxID=3375154 RepID=UPI0037A2CC8F